MSNKGKQHTKKWLISRLKTSGSKNKSTKETRAIQVKHGWQCLNVSWCFNSTSLKILIFSTFMSNPFASKARFQASYVAVTSSTESRHLRTSYFCTILSLPPSTRPSHKLSELATMLILVRTQTRTSNRHYLTPSSITTSPIRPTANYPTAVHWVPAGFRWWNRHALDSQWDLASGLWWGWGAAFLVGFTLWMEGSRTLIVF